MRYLLILLLTSLSGWSLPLNLPFINPPLASGGLTNVTGSISNWWRFDDNGGTTATNAVVANAANTGTLNFTGGGANPTWVSGKIGQALQFDGIGSEVDLAINNANGSVPCTLSAWLYRTASGGTIIYDSDSDGSAGWFFYVSSGKIVFQVPGAASDMVVSITDSSSSSTWYHVCVTWDGNNLSTAGTHIYINGTEGSYVTQTAGSGSHGPYAAGLRFVGKGGTGASGFWTGKIDDVRVYGRALSSGEVNVLYQWSGQP